MLRYQFTFLTKNNQKTSTGKVESYREFSYHDMQLLIVESAIPSGAFLTLVIQVQQIFLKIGKILVTREVFGKSKILNVKVNCFAERINRKHASFELTI